MSRPAPAASGAASRPRTHLRLLNGGGAAADLAASSPGRHDRMSTRGALLLLVGILCAIGLVMVLSASAYTSLQDYGSVWTIFERQVLWMVLGVIALAVTSRFPYERWRRLRLPLLAVTTVLLLAVLVPGVGVSSGGSSRWIGFGLLRIQPSELMKLALAVFAADLLSRRAKVVDRFGAVTLPLMLVLGVAGLLVLVQPDMGTAIVLTCIVFGLLFAGGVPRATVFKTMAVAAVVGAGAALSQSYRRARLLSFINPLAHRNGSGYQVVQSLVGLGNGHLFGLGLGNGHQKWGLLPNPHTDFIFSVIGEEAGLVGTLVVLALFFAFAWYGLRAASRAPDRFGSLLAVACVCWITSQAVINMGAVISVLPVTGIPLPFISFGGSSLVIIMAATGILINIAGRDPAAPHPRPRRRPRLAARQAAS